VIFAVFLLAMAYLVVEEASLVVAEIADWRAARRRHARPSSTTPAGGDAMARDRDKVREENMPACRGAFGWLLIVVGLVGLSSTASSWAYLCRRRPQRNWAGPIQPISGPAIHGKGNAQMFDDSGAQRDLNDPAVRDLSNSPVESEWR
jgi:hypothetical protein